MICLARRHRHIVGTNLRRNRARPEWTAADERPAIRDRIIIHSVVIVALGFLMNKAAAFRFR